MGREVAAWGATVQNTLRKHAFAPFVITGHESLSDRWRRARHRVGPRNTALEGRTVPVLAPLVGQPGSVRLYTMLSS